jgi:hypothetical protein
MGGRSDGCRGFSFPADWSFLLHTLLTYVNQVTPFITWFSLITLQWTEYLDDCKGIVKCTAGRKQTFSVEMCRGRSTIHGTFPRPRYNERISWIWHCFVTRMICGFVSDQWLPLLCSLLCSDVLGFGTFGLQNIWLVVCLHSYTSLRHSGVNLKGSFRNVKREYPFS